MQFVIPVIIRTTLHGSKRISASGTLPRRGITTPGDADSHPVSRLMPPRVLKRRPAYGEKCCPHCGKTFNVRGYGRHEQACRRHHELSEIPIPAVYVDGINSGKNTDDTDPEQSKGGTLHMNMGHKLPATKTRITDDEATEIGEDPHAENTRGPDEPDGMGANTSSKCGLDISTNQFAHPVDPVIANAQTPIGIASQ